MFGINVQLTTGTSNSPALGVVAVATAGKSSLPLRSRHVVAFIFFLQAIAVNSLGNIRKNRNHKNAFEQREQTLNLEVFLFSSSMNRSIPTVWASALCLMVSFAYVT